MIVPVPYSALDAALPLHVVFGADWRVAHAGPTLMKLCNGDDPRGRPLAEVFETVDARRANGLDTSGKHALSLTLRYGHRPRLRGTAVELGERSGRAKLLNLSLYVTEWDRATASELSLRDFAPNDLVTDMLYLKEAKSLAMNEAHNLIGSLRGKASTAGKLALTDMLTGLDNRRALEQAMARAIDRLAPFALTHLDLDFFKAVNDTHGHAAGDAVLKQVAKVLRANTRSRDTVARVGGDEFVLLMDNVTDPAEIEHVARRIIAEVEEPVIYNGIACKVSTSLGTVFSTSYAHPDPAMLLADADKALYASKAAGRGTHRFWPLVDCQS